MNSSNNNKLPQFFKVFQPDRSSESLLIPPAFKDRINGELPNRVFLKNGAGKSCLVDVKTIGINSYFQGGWSRFVSDNSLSFGDFLVFKYSGQRIFDVVILGRNGCVKELETSIPGKKLAEDKVEKEEDEGVDDEDEDDDEDEVMYNANFQKSSLKQNSHVKINRKNEVEDEYNDSDEDDDDDDDNEDDDDEDDEEDDEEDDDDEDEDEDNEEDNEDEDEDNEEDNEDEDENLSSRKNKMLHKKNGRGRPSVPKEAKLHKDISEYIPKNNPYLITSMKKSDLDYNRILIPKSVRLKDLKMKLSDNIILQDPKGRNWESKKSVWQNGQVWIQGGWKNFCASNQVKEGDIIIGEFLPQSNRTCDCIKFQIIKPD